MLPQRPERCEILHRIEARARHWYLHEIDANACKFALDLCVTFRSQGDHLVTGLDQPLEKLQTEIRKRGRQTCHDRDNTFARVLACFDGGKAGVGQMCAGWLCLGPQCVTG